MDRQVLSSEETAFVQALHELAPLFGVVLDNRLVQILSGHYITLLRWNRKVDLTSVVSPQDAAQFHYLESLYAVQYFKPKARSLVDIGSGGGFPGFPIAAAKPDIQTVLIENQYRKVVFLQTVSRHLGIDNVSVFQGRFQDYQPQNFDIVTCRAIDKFSEVLPELFQFASTAQQFFLFTGPGLADQCLRIVHDSWNVQVVPIPLADRRLLVSLSHLRST